MKILKEISEDEVIALFLKSEIESPRWKEEILNILKKRKVNRSIIDTPNFTDRTENNTRLETFDLFRGYAQRKRLFGGFPHDVRWYRAVISTEELEKVRFINWFWEDITEGTRSPRDAARLIKEGKITKDILRTYKFDKNTIYPEMVFVGTDKNSELVVLEGHTRLTSMFLNPQNIPKNIQVIVGLSPKMNKWSEY